MKDENETMIVLRIYELKSFVSIANIIHKINLFEIVDQTNENTETIGSIQFSQGHNY